EPRKSTLTAVRQEGGWKLLPPGMERFADPADKAEAEMLAADVARFSKMAIDGWERIGAAVEQKKYGSRPEAEWALRKMAELIIQTYGTREVEGKRVRLDLGTPISAPTP